ncbi:UNVERIFIED_CONTAM: hypothetical protein GTU68_006702 [Idotea baltica]|nr:hypothetical protein [Idotea baltica]
MIKGSLSLQYVELMLKLIF